MIIREFTECDIDEITSLMKNLCLIKGQDFDEIRWRKSLESKMRKSGYSEVLVAFDKNTNEVIGMGHCSIKAGDYGTYFGYISNLIVKEEKRRAGVGEAIMKHMIDYCKRNHIESIRLALKPNIDDAANMLFKKLGFCEISRIFELKI